MCYHDFRAGLVPSPFQPNPKTRAPDLGSPTAHLHPESVSSLPTWEVCPHLPSLRGWLASSVFPEHWSSSPALYSNPTTVLSRTVPSLPLHLFFQLDYELLTVRDFPLFS